MFTTSRFTVDVLLAKWCLGCTFGEIAAITGEYTSSTSKNTSKNWQKYIQ